MTAAAAAACRAHVWRIQTSSSGEMRWGTPPALYAALDREFDFTLDAAADAGNAQHIRYFDRELDALGQSWAGERVFCNPPFGRALGRWLEKARLESAEREPGALVVMLVPARVDTAWFHDIVLPYAEVRFLRGRLNYTLGGAASSRTTRCPFASMVCVFRPEDSRHAERPAKRQLLLGFGGRSV